MLIEIQSKPTFSLQVLLTKPSKFSFTPHFIKTHFKIWDISRNDFKNEVVGFKHSSGVSLIKWKPKSFTELCVISSRLDTSITTYDINQLYYPMSKLKAHTDIVTSFVIDPNEFLILILILISLPKHNCLIGSILCRFQKISMWFFRT